MSISKDVLVDLAAGAIWTGVAISFHFRMLAISWFIDKSPELNYDAAMFHWIRNLFKFGNTKSMPGWEEAELAADDLWEAEHPELAYLHRKHSAYHALKRFSRDVVSTVYSEKIVKEIEDAYARNPNLDRDMLKHSAKRWMKMFPSGNREGNAKCYGEEIVKEIENELSPSDSELDDSPLGKCYNP